MTKTDGSISVEEDPTDAIVGRVLEALGQREDRKDLKEEIRQAKSQRAAMLAAAVAFKKSGELFLETIEKYFDELSK